MQHRSNDVGGLLFAFCKSIDTPRALGCWLRFKYCGLRAVILETSIHPREYADPSLFRRDYLISNFLKKFKGEIGVDTKAQALSSFREVELRMAEMNRLLRARPKTLEADLFGMQRVIARILGTCPMNAMRECVWTSGANDDCKKSHAFPDTKISRAPISVTRSARSKLLQQISYDPHWFEALTGFLPAGPYSALPSLTKVVEGGRFDTVPKNAKTDRTIIVEPRGNTFLQKGVGSYLRRRLKQFGVDLDDQSRNQRLAARAFHDELATIDLEAASDSISLELVRAVLPLDWAFLLEDLRSAKIKVHGEFVPLSKFSSMGNAYTFELESLLFYAALCVAVDNDETILERDCAVYGDDIILPQRYAHRLMVLLGEIGFRVNHEKSFTSGAFYESCGEHFFAGECVTPIYQKELLSDHEVIRSHNRVFRAHCRFSRYGVDLTSVVAYLRGLPNRFNRCRMPSWCDGDEAFLVDPDSLPFHKNKGYESYVLLPETPAPVMSALSAGLHVKAEFL